MFNKITVPNARLHTVGLLDPTCRERGSVTGGGGCFLLSLARGGGVGDQGGEPPYHRVITVTI